jgi:hypothetical protein
MFKMKKSFCGGAFLAAFLASNPALAVQVDLQVNNSVSPPALEVTNNTSPCAGQPGNSNCIEVRKGSQPHMYFNLKKACKAGGPSYKLTKFRITEKDKDWPSSQNPMNRDVAKDFCADRSTGYVELRNCQNQRKDDTLKLKNFNQKPATVYYEIAAEPCSGSGSSIYLDPQIRNKGTN